MTKAAIAVIAENGIEGLTHRAVARAAAVPLGSTTGHFANREEILAAALTRAAAESGQKFSAWARSVGPNDDLVEALVELIVHDSTEERDALLVGYALYLAVLSRPALRPAAAQWSSNLRRALEGLTDPESAAALAAAAEGIMVVNIATAKPVDPDEARAIFTRVYAPPEHAERGQLLDQEEPSRRGVSQCGSG